MLPDKNQNIALSDRGKLLEQAFCAIIKLEKEEQKQVLSKYASIYGVDLEG